MRARVAAAVTLVAASLASVVPVPETAPAAGAGRLLVSADEYRLVLSRERVGAGRAVVQLLNRGEDDHDLRVRRVPRAGRMPGGAVQVEVAAPGTVVERAVTLRPGRYRLWCSLPDHRRLGMRALLRVTNAR
jgi:uncharacterized cupredoxin-like copper-binding protein